MVLSQKLKIILIVFGTLPEALVQYLVEGLSRELNALVVTPGSLPIPGRAYEAHRHQYQAEAFLPLLTPWRREPMDLALGVTTVDLFVPGLNFVFGLAEFRQRQALISVARLDPQFYRQPPNPALLHRRALKEAVHELGHLLGLAHCPSPRCIMFFSNTLADTDRKELGFCQACRARLPGWAEKGPGT